MLTRRILPILLGAATLQTTACNTRTAPPNEPSAAVQASDRERNPTVEEVTKYLVGKEIELDLYLTHTKLPRPLKPMTIREAGIENLTVALGTPVGENQFGNNVSFLYQDGKDRYAVDAVITHKMIGDKRAYYSLHWRTVTLQ